MNGNSAEKIRKIIWHIRWIILVLLIGFSAIAFIHPVGINYFLYFHGLLWPIYFLAYQLEDYFECKANCKL